MKNKARFEGVCILVSLLSVPVFLVPGFAAGLWGLVRVVAFLGVAGLVCILAAAGGTNHQPTAVGRNRSRRLDEMFVEDSLHPI